MADKNDSMAVARREAKEVICTIIAVAGGRLHKKVTLFKAFYYAHLFYWQERQQALTDYPIVRMPQGPGIDDHFSLLTELQAEGRVVVHREAFGPFQEYVYTLARSFTVDPADPRYGAVEKAVKWVEGRSAALLSEETHDYSRSWQRGKDGEELNVYIDLLSDEEYEDMRRRLDAAGDMVRDAFAAV